MRSSVYDILPPKVTRSLTKFGSDLSLARRKRHLPEVAGVPEVSPKVRGRLYRGSQERGSVRRPSLSLEFLRFRAHKWHFIAPWGHQRALIEQNLAPACLAPP